MPRRRATLLRWAALSILAALAITTTLAWLAMFLPTGNAWRGPRLNEDLGLWQEDGDHEIWLIRRGTNAWHTAVDYHHLQVSGRSIMMRQDDYEANEFDYRQHIPRHLRPASLTDLNMTGTYHETGWPFKALACSVHWRQQVANADILYTVRGGLQLPRDKDFNPRALPLTPLWPGLAANTALFAGLVFLTITAAATTRRQIRIRRGRCPHCSYSLAGLPPTTPCPECAGNSSARRARHSVAGG